MKGGVLIIDPGLKLLYNRSGLHADVYFPRGALSLVSYLRAQDIPCRFLLLDGHIDGSLPFEKNEEAVERIIEEEIAASEPQLVGVSCVFTMQYPLSLRILETVRKLRPKTGTVIGGSHVTFLDRECLEESTAVDFVVRGEGEWTLSDLSSRIISGLGPQSMQGITRREGNRIVRNPPRPLGNLDDLPPIDYGLLPDGYLENIAINITASRGCAFRCTYCVEQRFWQNRVRRIPANRIIEEINVLSRRFANPYFTLEDSMFSVDSAYFHDFCRKLREVGDRSFTIGHIVSRVDTVSREGLEAMRDAGIRGIIFGIESASDEVLAAMNKRITIDQAREACRLASGLGLTTGTFWLFGHPGDSPERAQKSLDVIEEFYREGLHCGITASMFVPYPGTPFYENPGAHGLEILSRDWEKWGRFNEERICRLDTFPEDLVIEYYRRAVDLRNRCQVIPQLREWMEKNTMDLPNGVRLLYYDLAGYGIPSRTEAIANILEVAGAANPVRFASVIASSREITVTFSSDLSSIMPVLTLLKEAAARVGGIAEGDFRKAFLRGAELPPEKRTTVKDLLIERLLNL